MLLIATLWLTSLFFGQQWRFMAQRNKQYQALSFNMYCNILIKKNSIWVGLCFSKVYLAVL